ncbi:hypothetical protein BN2497_14465 [Janthinobacterium sp. CG23_2]|nr:hypothetical protein BN2497_14465 [Janthinobacterium sp. CG23_2]CUU33630.1 hypothetical protein BN3177_14465 [Janthinobacterium sp. CG23_2]
MNICELNPNTGQMITRPGTPAELAQREIDIAAAALPVVPKVVPMLNAHLELIEGGYMEQIDAYLEGLEGIPGMKARATFRVAQTVRRDHELVEIMRVVLNRTHAEIDTLFINAAARG